MNRQTSTTSATLPNSVAMETSRFGRRPRVRPPFDSDSPLAFDSDSVPAFEFVSPSALRV
ncbi:hypothetical protein A4G99_20345 [Haladaptatus sp. R4]|nr:hypothetical protein A4G99_20345 [Haladaptatus sp. R4]